MTQQTTQNLEEWIGRSVDDSSGHKIGKITDIYLDDQTGQPEWLAVNTGMFGNRVSFVPLSGATPTGNALQVPYTKDQVKDAPNASADGHLSQDDEARLYTHYGYEYGERHSDSGLPEGGRAPAGPTPGGDEAMTRSEEELAVGTTSREAGRVRLRKWVDTERVETTVPVAREEARIEREPVTDANIDRAMSGPEIAESEHEIVLNEEVASAETRVTPKERIRLEKDVVIDDQKVEADLRKERVEVQDESARTTRR